MYIEIEKKKKRKRKTVNVPTSSRTYYGVSDRESCRFLFWLFFKLSVLTHGNCDIIYKTKRCDGKMFRNSSLQTRFIDPREFIIFLVRELAAN